MLPLFSCFILSLSINIAPIKDVISMPMNAVVKINCPYASPYDSVIDKIADCSVAFGI